METMPAYFAAFAEKMGNQLKAVHQRLTDMDSKFDTIDKRFDAIDNRFDAVESRFDTVDDRFDAVDSRFDVIDNRFNAVDDKLDLIAMTVKRHDEVLDEHSILLRAMAGRHDNHEERITSLERSVTRLRVKIDS